MNPDDSDHYRKLRNMLWWESTAWVIGPLVGLGAMIGYGLFVAAKDYLTKPKKGIDP